MFTGIVEELGRIKGLHRSSLAGSITIEATQVVDGAKIGDSIAVNGTCLTVTRITQDCFDADISPETLNKTVLGDLKPGHRVNLERAMRLSDRLNGHMVSGHVDGTGIILEKKTVGNAVIVTIRIPKLLSNYLINKGSIAIDGISLTVNDCQNDLVTLSIIPLTAKITTIGFKHPGDRVNIEIDIVAKYLEQFLVKQRNLGHIPDHSSNSSITTGLLSRNGFL